VVTRWQPDARGRLQQAAIELFAERGYERTTVAEIAQRAGLTERTFFRHFPDKREVLFDGANTLQHEFVGAVTGAPVDASPIDAVTAGLRAAGTMLEERGPFAGVRQRIIAGSEELQEREAKKLLALSAAIADALRERGVPEPAASLAADAAISVFRIGFERWIAQDAHSLWEILDEALDELRAITAGAPVTSARG
jgi:AcrR family transcriptional regulator